MDKKTETPELEQAADNYATSRTDAGTFRNSLKFEGFTAGAEWQSQRMFTREDMEKCWKAAIWFTADSILEKEEIKSFDGFMEANYPEKK